MKYSISQAGDTLVEVMIALAIMGLVLGGSYASATSSLRGARMAQERTEAIKIAENQLERLKAQAPASSGTTGPTTIFRSTPYCIDPSTQLPVDWTGGNTPAATPETDNFARYPSPACNNSGRYYYVIQYNAAADDTFKVWVRWDRIGGGRDQVEMLYHLHRF